RLVYEQRHAEIAEDRLRLAGLLGRVRRDADVYGLPLARPPPGRAHRLLEGSLGIEAVRVEDVDVFEPHPPEALVEACQQVLARAPFAVRAPPHVVARLRRYDELVSVWREIKPEDVTEPLLRRAVGRPVVV